jgi:L-alanine-DL-glutamate epimerase-like enolase superfamily enzyme
MRAEAPIEGVEARAYEVPTDAPEADGTFAWDSTTIVVVHVRGGGGEGLGYSYTHASAAKLITGTLAGTIEGRSALDVSGCWMALQRRVRNLGREGIAATAISALDCALWDLKAKLLGLPLCKLLGMARDRVPIYGSGGFTSYSDAQLREQLGGWVARDGCRYVKMKIGSDPGRDPHRVAVARQAIGDEAQLFVDANGAYTPQEALLHAAGFAACGVRWFEEPVSSDDLAGLRAVRARIPRGMDVAAGEYAYTPGYVARMLAAGAVDVQQADITRVLGVSGFLAAAALCEAHHVDLSGHCAPALHLHAACAAPRFRHLEWFHDHVRIEHMLFDGAPAPRDGAIMPDLTRPGFGLAFKREDSERFES